ncbi:MAG: HEPN domain-containing protein [Chloroflexi bacterium]|nr:HEPN domain-containing protein [Chloroflexota bacterium]
MTEEQAALLKRAGKPGGSAIAQAERFFNIAVSRAYYTMFYVAEALLAGEGLSFSKHAGVIAAFGQHFAKTGRVPAEFHRYLIEGQDKRNTGDYDIGINLSAEQAAQQIVHAEAFLELARKLLGELPKPETSGDGEQ